MIKQLLAMTALSILWGSGVWSVSTYTPLKIWHPGCGTICWEPAEK